MKETKKLAVAGILIAIGVACSAFSIPVGFAKCFPIQHGINVIAAITLGPLYAVIAAFATSTIRLLLGMGTPLAFPGSMIGAWLCGLLYSKTKKIWAAYLGEVLGTGVLGALAAYPVAAFVMGRTVALFAYVIPFSVSTIVGGFVAVLLIKALIKTGALEKGLGPIQQG